MLINKLMLKCGPFSRETQVKTFPMKLWIMSQVKELKNRKKSCNQINFHAIFPIFLLFLLNLYPIKSSKDLRRRAYGV